MFKKVFAALLCLLFLLPAVSTAYAGDAIILKYAWVDPYDPAVQSTSAYAVTFKSELERLSGGRIRVELYPAGQLGDQRSTVEQIAKGSLEMCNISSGVLASLYYDKLGIVDMPFLFSSREHAARCLDVRNPLIKEMVEECAEETNVRILNLCPFGPRHITNNRRSVRTPEDMKGLKIRTMEVVPHMRLMESLGASPVPIPFIELYTSLQTNVVDGQENPLQNVEAQKYFQVQKYLTTTGHVMGIGGNLISDAFYRSLPEDLRLALVEADRVGQLTYNGMGALFDAVGAENLRKEGMEIYSPTAEEMEMFRAVAIPYVREYMESELGTEFVGAFLAEVDAAKKTLLDESSVD